MRRAKHIQNDEALVVVFDSTASAFAFADAAVSAGLGGRLIPVPRTLSAGCGIAWRDQVSQQQAVQAIVEAEVLDDARVVRMQLR